MERNEREKAAWEAQTSEAEKLAMELSMCLQAVDTINRLWDVSGDEDRQGMVRHLFEYLVFDLEKQQLVDFRLKPWADQFLYLRVAAYMDGCNELHYNDNPVAPTGFDHKRRYTTYNLEFSMNLLCFAVYYQPYEISGLTPKQRNDLIRMKYSTGDGISDLAREYKLSPQRVHQIVNHRQH